MFDPESRRGESTAADVYFFFLFCSLPVWVDKCAWCLFYGESLSYEKKKQKQARREKKPHLCSIHFMLEPVEALQHQEALHMNTLIGTRRSFLGGSGKGDYGAIISCQAAFQEMVSLWDHDASSSWTCFFTCWRTIQPLFLFKMLVSLLD